jgi:ParB/RepB/Spo0J family partition protein
MGGDAMSGRKTKSQVAAERREAVEAQAKTGDVWSKAARFIEETKNGLMKPEVSSGRPAKLPKPELPHRDYGMIPVANITTPIPNIRRYSGADITPAIDARLSDLAESIRLHGVIEPLVVQQAFDDVAIDRYVLIAGFRRLAASRLAKQERVPACIYRGELSPAQITEIQITENIQRSDLAPTEEAAIYRHMSVAGQTQEEIAARVGKSVRHVSRYLKLLSLPEELQVKIDTGEVTMAKAQVLLSLSKINIQAFLDGNTYLLSSSYSTSEFVSQLKRRYFRELSGEIGFDIDVEYAVPYRVPKEKLPPCSACPHRGQLELFEEFVTDSSCPNAECFDRKSEAARIKREEEEEEEEEEEDKARSDDGESDAARLKRNAEREEHWKRRNEELAAERRKDAEKARDLAVPLIERKFDIGFTAADVFFLANEEAPLWEEGRWSEAHFGEFNKLCRKYIGQGVESFAKGFGVAAIKEKGSITHAVQAWAICYIYECAYNDYLDDVKQWLGLEVAESAESEESEESEEDGDMNDEEKAAAEYDQAMMIWKKAEEEAGDDDE